MAAGAVVQHDADDRQAERKEPEKRRGEPPAAFEGFVVLAVLRRGMARRQGVARELRDELLNRGIRVEADLDGVGPHEGAAENAAGQARQLIPLESLERAYRNFRRVRNLAQRDAAALTGLAELAAEAAGDAFCSHEIGTVVD